MEFPTSDTIYIPLREELIAKIQATTEIVGDTYDNAKAANYIDTLNNDLREAKLTGESVQLDSQMLIWSSARYEDGKTIIEPVMDPKTLKLRTVIGTFTGVEEMELEGLRTLVYRISVDYDEETMTSRSVLAPVDATTMLVGTEGSFEAKISQTLSDNLRKLHEIEDPKFRETLKDFIDLFEETEEKDATFIQEVGILSAWLLAHDEVKNDNEKRKAIGKILKTILVNSDRYRIAGTELAPHPDGKTQSTTVGYINTVNNISGIALIDDFDTNATKNIEFTGTSQLAFIVKDAKNVKHNIPLRFILEFTPVTYEDYCRSSIQRFLQANPNFIKLAGFGQN
ncbi:MAG: hypothetical protein JWM52_355 [Candidatus Saccharibacteria bacterium]|nr:hypothetical protein [Candidatus Saccharibacteria bacterium]